MDAEAHGELYPFLMFQARVQARGDGLDNTQTRVQGTLGIVFVCLGPAKIDQQGIAEQLGDVAIKALKMFQIC
jgi:hypothetical protein